MSIFKRKKTTQAKFDAVMRQARSENGPRKRMYDLFEQMHEGNSTTSAKAEEDFVKLFSTPAAAKKVYNQLMQGEVDREGWKNLLK